MDSGRRILLHPRYIEGFRVALREARGDLHEMHYRHLCELAALRAEVAELREILSMIVGTLRTQAETDLATLRRQLERALARIERDPNNLLH